MNNVNLKQSTISGLIWSFTENIVHKGIVFLIGIVLARLLSPKDFGLIGMVTIFFAISQSFIDSGFTQALIRKTDCTQKDYSTIFYFNLIVSIFLYFILFLFSESIANFFNESQLENILKVLGISLIINSFSIVQKAVLTKRIDFKLQTIITVIASLISGIIAIIMAYKEFGVWSLVAQTLIAYGIIAILLWIWNKWKPSLVFSMDSFKSLFSFGSKLLVSGLIDTLYRNVYLLVIGKYFNAAELGFYTRAEQFKNLPSENITGVIQRVTFPVLSLIQNDLDKLKSYYRKMTKATMLVTFFLMMSMAGSAEQLILVLIGEKWQSSVIYLQLLCFVGIFFPLRAINLNILKVLGHSNIILKLEIIQKIIVIPFIIIGVILGIKYLIVGMIIHALISYFINSYYSGKLIGYSVKAQIRDIIPSFVLSVFIGFSLIIIGRNIELPMFKIFLIQIFVSIILLVTLSELFKIDSYLLVKKLTLEQLEKSTKKKKNEE